MDTTSRPVPSNEMVERVARAMFPDAFGPMAPFGAVESRGDVTPDKARALARAAIEAMREVTRDMAIAGQDALDACVESDWDGNRHDYTTISPSAPAEVYRAMIDAALQEARGDE